MKDKNVAGFRNITAFISDKIKRLSKEEKTFKVLFDFMFEQEENILSETSSYGYRFQRVSYGEAKAKAIDLAKKIKHMLADQKEGQTVGLHMSNSVEWLEVFWAILMSGFNPLLINSRLPKEQLEKELANASVVAVISEKEEFSVKTLIFEDVENAQERKELNLWGEEVYFMSSGTSDNVKLCAYNAEGFYYQVANSMAIIKGCPNIVAGYQGQVKLLALLPFYHVFGFIAVYIWFGFFARTLVFLKDLNPQTLLSTVRKHRVTHIFAVPMVWETIYKQAIKKIQAKGEETYEKFLKASATINKKEKLGSLISKVAFKEIREGLFGESIRFLISGGSGISNEALEFLNTIGYFAVNGYGMTEVAITSVETSKKRKVRNLNSIGAPFTLNEYKISESGELLIKSKARACKIIKGSSIEKTNLDEWFNTQDVAKCVNGRYYVLGRKDDLIVSSSGENINPTLVENVIQAEEVKTKCLVKGKNGATLILELNGYLSEDKLKEVEEKAQADLKANNFDKEVKEIVLTYTNLIEENEFKVSRTKIAKKLNSGKIEKAEITQNANEEANDIEKEIIAVIKEVLGQDVEIAPNDDFFVKLNGSSLDYFEIITILRDKFALREDVFDEKGITTVKQFAEEIMKEIK